MSEIIESTKHIEYYIRELEKTEKKINNQLTKNQPLKSTVTEIFNYVKLSHTVNVELTKLNTLYVNEKIKSKIMAPETLDNISTMVLPRILERLDDFIDMENPSK